MRVTIKKDFLIRTIAGEQVLIGYGEQINFSKMLMLNYTGAHVIEELQKQSAPVPIENLAQNLTDNYNKTTYEEVLSDVKELILYLEKQGVVTVEYQ